MAGDSKSLSFDNSIFESALAEQSRHTVKLTTAVWANLTGTLQVTNSQFNGFGTDYGALSVFATNVTISGCSFTNNIAATAGAGLYITGALQEPSCPCRHQCFRALPMSADKP